MKRIVLILLCLALHSAAPPRWTATPLTTPGAKPGAMLFQLADCEEGTVDAAVDAASAGSTVTLPSPCTATWTSQVSITNKELVLTASPCTLNADGQPTSCPTVITINMGTNPLLVTTCSAANFVEISNLEFLVTTGLGSSGVIAVSCTAANGYPAQTARIHHIKISGSPSGGGRWMAWYANYGLVDHSYFTSSTMGNISALQDNTISTCNSYHEPFTIGDANALYIENNYFYHPNPNIGNGHFDNYMGMRYVVRFNTIYNDHSGHHGLDSGNCGNPTFEYYGNTFIAESGVTSFQAIHPRSGTGIVWGNKVQNITGVANGITSLIRPIYYGGVSDAELVKSLGALWYSVRAARYYPAGTWGPPYTSTSNYTDGVGNYVTGAHLIDGNFSGNGADAMDSDYTRTVTDMVTTEGSTTITSADANFVNDSTVTGDLWKYIIAENFKRGYRLSCTTTSGSVVVTCPSGNFDLNDDLGRQVSDNGRTAFTNPNVTTIADVNSATEIEMTHTADASGTKILKFADPYIVSITNESTAVMNVKATADGTGKSLTIGFSKQGYPLADQPGRGYFAIANAGLWPTQTSYTEANYQALMPIYMVGNLWQSVSAALVVSTSTNPPATTPLFTSTAGYIKANRDWYDPYPNQAGAGIQTNASTPFDGTAGTGIGTLANRPATCTTGVGYWSVNTGSWNTSAWTYTYPHGGSSYSQGVLYRCTATDTWTLYYTPYNYPHPLQGAPTLTSVTPDQGFQNSVTSVTLVGAGFDAGSFDIQVSGSNVTPGNIAGSGATTRTADFTIAAGAATGERTVTVSTTGGTSNGIPFTVLAVAAPTLTSIVPPQCYRGTTCPTTFTGTTFNGGNGTLAESCSGVSFSSITVVSATVITALTTVTANATEAACSVTVTTDGGTSNAELIAPLNQHGAGAGRLRGR